MPAGRRRADVAAAPHERRAGLTFALALALASARPGPGPGTGTRPRPVPVHRRARRHAVRQPFAREVLGAVREDAQVTWSQVRLALKLAKSVENLCGFASMVIDTYMYFFSELKFNIGFF